MLIQRGKPWFDYKEKILTTLEYYNFSDRFGWTPKQIKEIDEEDKRMYLSFMAGVCKAKPLKNGGIKIKNIGGFK